MPRATDCRDRFRQHKRFTRPKPNDVSRPAAPRSSTEASSFVRVCAAVNVGFLVRMMAATPATWGVAIDVPDSVVYDEFDES